MTDSSKNKTISVTEEQFRDLELARIKHENEFQKRAGSFGKIISFLANRYLVEGEKLNNDERK